MTYGACVVFVVVACMGREQQQPCNGAHSKIHVQTLRVCKSVQYRTPPGLRIDWTALWACCAMYVVFLLACAVMRNATTFTVNSIDF